TRAVAAWGSLSAVGAVSGVLLSGVAATWVPWRWLIAFPAWVAALAAFTAPRLLPSPPPVRGRLDVLGALLATGGLTALSYGLVTTLDQPWSAPGVVGPLAGGVGLLGAFSVAEARAPAPVLRRSCCTWVPRLVPVAARL